MATATKKKQPPKQGMKWAKSLGKPIEDATAPLEIRLTSADIRRGRRKSQTSCAFACGIERQESAAAVWVGTSSVFVEWSDKVLRYAVPHSVKAEIISFDRSRQAATGTFHLTPPPKSQRLGIKPKRSGTNVRSGKSPHRHHTAMVRHG